jgi:hypothetical protein
MPSISRKKRLLKEDRRRKSRKVSGGGMLDEFINKVKSVFGMSTNKLETAATEFKKLKDELQIKIREVNSLFDKISPVLEKCKSSMNTATEKMDQLQPAMAAQGLGVAAYKANEEDLKLPAAQQLPAPRDDVPRAEISRDEISRDEISRDDVPPYDPRDNPTATGGGKKSKRKTKRKPK